MGYISLSVFTTKHKCSIKIEKNDQIKNFEIPYYSTNSTPRWFSNFIFVHHFNFDSKFVSKDGNWVGNIPHMQIFVAWTENIPIRQVCAKTWW